MQMVTLARANDDVSPCTLDMRLYLTDPDSDGGRGGVGRGAAGEDAAPADQGKRPPPTAWDLHNRCGADLWAGVPREA